MARNTNDADAKWEFFNAMLDEEAKDMGIVVDNEDETMDFDNFRADYQPEAEESGTSLFLSEGDEYFKTMDFDWTDEEIEGLNLATQPILCESCNQTYSTEESFKKHIKTKKHEKNSRARELAREFLPENLQRRSENFKLSGRNWT